MLNLWIGVLPTLSSILWLSHKKFVVKDNSFGALGR